MSVALPTGMGWLVALAALAGSWVLWISALITLLAPRAASAALLFGHLVALGIAAWALGFPVSDRPRVPRWAGAPLLPAWAWAFGSTVATAFAQRRTHDQDRPFRRARDGGFTRCMR